jgi:hypothetical protein
MVSVFHQLANKSKEPQRNTGSVKPAESLSKKNEVASILILRRLKVNNYEISSAKFSYYPQSFDCQDE